MRNFLIAVLAISFLLTGYDASAQRRRGARGNVSKFKGFKQRFGKNKQYQSLGISVSAVNYFGDITPGSGFASFDISFTRPAIGIEYTRRIGPRFEVVGAFTWATIKGDDFKSADPNDNEGVFRYIRNLSFRNQIKELSALFYVDLFDNNGTYITRSNWTPFVFAGAALVLHNPQAKAPEGFENAGDWVDLQPLGTEGQNSDLYNLDPYSKATFAIPFGIGVRWKINQNMDMSFEIGYRQTFTDYLDDVSGDYATLQAFPDGSMAWAMSDRSREVNSANGDARNLEGIPRAQERQTVNPTVDSRPPYEIITGYGADPDIDFGLPDQPKYIRGNPNDNDIYIFTGFHVKYIIGGNYRRAKFR